MIQRRKTPRPPALWVQIRDAKNSAASSRSPGSGASGSGGYSSAESRGSTKKGSGTFYKRRSAASQQTPSKRRAGLRKRSPSLSRSLRLYSSLRITFLARHATCAVFSGRRSTEIHHKFGRVGRLLCWEPGWVPVSKEGHEWIHNNIKTAMELGLICETGHWNDYKKALIAQGACA